MGDDETRSGEDVLCNSRTKEVQEGEKEYYQITAIPGRPGKDGEKGIKEKKKKNSDSN